MHFFPFLRNLKEIERKDSLKPVIKSVHIVKPKVEKQQPGQYLKISNSFSINTQDWKKTGDRDIVLASSGMGKSYLCGVILEEILENKGLLFIIDPEGEYHTLAEEDKTGKHKHYPMIVAGGENSNVKLDLDTATTAEYHGLIQLVLSKGISIIFDLSERSDENKQALYTKIVNILFNIMDNDHFKRPIKVVIDEAALFAPQQGVKMPKIDGETALTTSTKLANRARKRGINLLWLTQRPAGISKAIISQCNRWWFGGVTSQQDCDALKNYIKSAGIAEEEVRALKPGDFYYWHSGGLPVKIRARERYCKHGGETPLDSKNLKIASEDEVLEVLALLNKK